MNYFAHGLRFVDRPWFLAGTAVPDWMSVADRKVRPRAKLAAPHADGSGTTRDRVAAGVLQHLEDDAWFHETRGFYEVTGAVARLLRGALVEDDGFRVGFLGHVVTELLLDGVLVERYPERLDAYYAALEEVDPLEVQQTVNLLSRGETRRLAPFVPLFLRARFLEDYVDPERLLYRLNQVLQRIRLTPLPDEVVPVLAEAKTVVADDARTLLPPDRFDWP